MGFVPVVLSIIVIAFIIAIIYWLNVCDTNIIGDSPDSPFDLSQTYRVPDTTKYWRVWLIAFASFVTAVLITHLQFSDTRWREQLWVAAQVGIFPGWLVGGVWHLLATKTFAKVRLKNFLIIASLFFILAGIGFFHSIPVLQSQQEQINLARSLSGDCISQVDIILSNANTINVTEPNSIENFSKFLADAKLSVKEEEKSTNLGTLRIKTYSDKTPLVYNIFTPNNHADDVVLKSSEKGSEVTICIPGLKRWLDKNISNREN